MNARHLVFVCAALCSGHVAMTPDSGSSCVCHHAEERQRDYVFLVLFSRWPGLQRLVGSTIPSMIDGGVSFGQYSRSMGMNLAFGAGSQLASFALPGESAWRYRSTEPSALVTNLLR